MDLVDEAGVAEPDLPFEDVACDPLGKAVRVRSLDLPQRLAIESRLNALRKARPDDGDAAAYPIIPEVLAVCVVGKAGAPVYSVQRWRVFGAKHHALTLELFNTAWRLSGMSDEATKKN